MDTGKAFADFLDECITPYQFGAYVRNLLNKEGYKEMSEAEEWDSIPEKGFIVRADRALVAFQLDKSNGMPDSMMIVGTHCDSPCLKIKPKFDSTRDSCREILCAPYGSGQWFTWFDRELRLAGRVYVKKDNEIEPVLFDSHEAVAICPSITDSLNPSKILNNPLHIISGLSQSPSIISYIAESLHVPEDSIVDLDLSLLDAAPARVFSGFICSGRIDNLGSTFAGLTAFLNSKPKHTANILVVFDHEEIGSSTRVGAKSDLLGSVIDHLFGKNAPQIIARSLLVSADNAHSVHPNWSGKYESAHAPILGKGLTIKKSPGALYSTDLMSEYPLKNAAAAVGCKLQDLINRNDIPGGSTIGPISSSIYGIMTVDVGQPQLAMHSICEMVAIKDVEENIKIFQELYNNYQEHRLKL